jgi:hypothetical protein
MVRKFTIPYKYSPFLHVMISTFSKQLRPGSILDGSVPVFLEISEEFRNL